MTDREVIDILNKRVEAMEWKIDAIIKHFNIVVEPPKESDPLPYIPAKPFDMQ